MMSDIHTYVAIHLAGLKVQQEEEAYVLKNHPSFYREWKRGREEAKKKAKKESDIERRHRELCQAIRYSRL